MFHFERFKRRFFEGMLLDYLPYIFNKEKYSRKSFMFSDTVSFYQKVKFFNTEEFLSDKPQAISGLLISAEEEKNVPTLRKIT